MQENDKSESFSAAVVMQKVKKVSYKIMQSIHDAIATTGKHKIGNDMLSEIKGKDTVVNVFLKISALLCKVLLIEIKLKEKGVDDDLNKLDNVTEVEKEIDIMLLENFLAQHKKKEIKVSKMKENKIDKRSKKYDK